MPSLILSNPLGVDDAQRIGLDARDYAVGEIVTVNDFVFVTLLRTGYGLPYGSAENVLIVGDGSPTENVGGDGQWYLDELNEVLWGPKTGGLWPGDPIRPDRGVQQLRLDGDQLRVTYSTGTSALLGRVRAVFRGAWAAGVDYAVDDLVTADAALFRVTTAHTSSAAPTRTTPGAGYEVLASTPDATAAAKGAVRLAGDLAGTADAPTVPALVGLDDRLDQVEGVAGAAIPAGQKGAAGGVATLDAGGRVPSAQLPPLALTDSHPVADEAQMLALVAQPGDIAVRGDGAGTFILRAEPASTLGNWLLLRAPTDAVTSVDGQTGAVSLGSAAAAADSLARRTSAGALLAAPAAADGELATRGQVTAAVAAGVADAARNRGSGTLLPTTDLRRGDVYDHATLGLHIYDGARWQPVDTYAGAMEGVGVYAYGHSYLAGEFFGQSQEQRYILRAAERLDFSIVNRAVGGFRMFDASAEAIGDRSSWRKWGVGTKGAVVIDCTINDVNVFGDTVAGRNGYRNALRALCEFVSLESVTDSEDASWTYTGFATNTLVDSFGGSNRRLPPNTAGSATRTFTGTEITVGLMGTVDTVAANVDILVDNVVVATVATHEQCGTATHTPTGVTRNYVHVTRRITGLAAGSHTLLVRPAGNVAQPGPIFLDFVGTRSATPPRITVMRCMDITDTTKDPVIDVYNAIIDEVAADFPHLAVCDATVGWDRATMIGSDGIHLSSRGNAHAATALVNTLSALDFTPGLDAGKSRVLPAMGDSIREVVEIAAGSFSTGHEKWTDQVYEHLSFYLHRNGFVTVTGVWRYNNATGATTTVAGLGGAYRPRGGRRQIVPGSFGDAHRLFDVTDAALVLRGALPTAAGFMSVHGHYPGWWAMTQ